MPATVFSLDMDHLFSKMGWVKVSELKFQKGMDVARAGLLEVELWDSPEQFKKFSTEREFIAFCRTL